MSDTFTLEIERPDNHNEEHTATIRFPDGTTHTVTNWNADEMFNQLQTAIAVFDAENPDTFTDRLSTSPDDRVQLALDALNAHDATLHTEYWEIDQEIVAQLSITTVEPFEELEWMCNLDLVAAFPDFTREHGFHLRAHWKVHDYGPNYDAFDEFDRDEFIQKYADKTIYSTITIDGLLAQYSEYETNPGTVVQDDTVFEWPRLAGTNHSAFHIAYRLTVNNDDVDDLLSDPFDELTDEDIDTALTYAENHPNAFDAYVEHRKQRSRNLGLNPDADNEDDDSDPEFVPLDPDDTSEDTPDTTE